MGKRRAVLFDFDGTLADSIGIWIEVVEQLLKEGMGLKETVSRDELVGLRKEGIYHAIKRWVYLFTICFAWSIGVGRAFVKG